MASENGACQITHSDEDKTTNESAQDQKNNAQQSETIPTDYVSPEIQKKIEQVVESKGVTEYTMVIEPGSSIGDNFMGFIGKVTITGLDETKQNITLNWIVKTAPQTDLYRKLMKVEVIYEREIYMYEIIFPKFANFQEEKSVLEPFNNYPKFIFSHMEPYQECFGMENSKSIGYVMRNRKEPLNYHHVKLLMKTYAKLHAVSLAMKDQRPEVFSVFQKNMKDIMNDVQDNKEDAMKSYKIIMEAAFNSLNPKTDQGAIKKFGIFLEKYMDIFDEGVNTTNKYSVIGHGDSWVNNMLWKYEDSSDQSTPTNVCLLDFQLARYGSPVCDLSYFLFTCTDKSLRDRHYDDAIRLYYYTLCGHVTEMGSDPEKLFPFSALQAELKRFSVVGMFWTVMVLSVITRESDELPDVKDNSLTEEMMTEQWGRESKNQAVYNKRVRDVIIDMYEKGYLDFLE